MKTSGIIRTIDGLGRVVLPVEIRRALDLSFKDTVEICISGDSIIMKKYKPSCIFCGSMEDANLYKGRVICKHCLADLKNGRFDEN